MKDRGKADHCGLPQTAPDAPEDAALKQTSAKAKKTDPKESWKIAKKAHYDRGEWLVFSYDNGKNSLYFGPNENHTGKASTEPYPELNYATFPKNVDFIKDNGFLRGYKLKTRFYNGDDGGVYNGGALCIATFICACATKSEARERQDRINGGENPFRSHVIRGNYSGIPGALFLPKPLSASGTVADEKEEHQVLTRSPEKTSVGAEAQAIVAAESTANRQETTNSTSGSLAKADEKISALSAETAMVNCEKPKWIVIFPSEEPGFKDLPTVGFAVLELEKEKFVATLKIPYRMVKTHGKAASFLDLQEFDLDSHVLLLPPNPAGAVPFGDMDILEVGIATRNMLPHYESSGNGALSVNENSNANQISSSSQHETDSSAVVSVCHENAQGSGIGRKSTKEPVRSDFLEHSDEDNDVDKENQDNPSPHEDSRPATPSKPLPKKRASSEPSPRKSMDPRRSNPKMKKEPGLLGDPFAYLKHKEKTERYSDLKNPDDVGAENCKLFDRESPWHFQIENRDPEAYRRLVKDFKVFIDKEGHVALSRALQPGNGQKPLKDTRYLYNLVRRLIGGTEGMRRAISIYHIQREEALKKRKKVTRFAERLFGEEFLDALKAHCKRKAKELNRLFAKPNNFDTFVTALIRSDGNHLFERYCSNNRIDWASILNHPMKRRTTVRQPKHRNMNSDSDSDGSEGLDE